MPPRNRTRAPHHLQDKDSGGDSALHVKAQEVTDLIEMMVFVAGMRDLTRGLGSGRGGTLCIAQPQAIPFSADFLERKAYVNACNRSHNLFPVKA